MNDRAEFEKRFKKPQMLSWSERLQRYCDMNIKPQPYSFDYNGKWLGWQEGRKSRVAENNQEAS